MQDACPGFRTIHDGFPDISVKGHLTPWRARYSVALQIDVSGPIAMVLALPVTSVSVIAYFPGRWARPRRWLTASPAVLRMGTVSPAMAAESSMI